MVHLHYIIQNTNLFVLKAALDNAARNLSLSQFSFQTLVMRLNELNSQRGVKWTLCYPQRRLRSVVSSSIDLSAYAIVSTCFPSSKHYFSRAKLSSQKYRTQTIR